MNYILLVISMVVSIYANSVDNTINLMLKNDKLFEIIDSTEKIKQQKWRSEQFY